MKKILSIALLGTALLGSGASLAAERATHFKGEASPDLVTAMANFGEYNQRLAKVLANKELTPEHLAEVHQLTYTLENALERIKVDVDILADTLEKVHVASETMEPGIVKTEGVTYLQAANPLAPASK